MLRRDRRVEVGGRRREEREEGKRGGGMKRGERCAMIV